MQILVAEHEDAPRVALAELLRAWGHDVLVAADGGAAWAAALAFGIDVVIADQAMPAMDGYELCRRIRALDEDDYTYVLLVGADATPAHALAAVTAGADDHLAKPLDPDALAARLIAAERVTELHRQLAHRRAELNRLNVQLNEAARTDSLTGCFNRRRLDEDVPVLDEGLARYGRPFAVGLVDVDRFKAYNDRYGHQGGDGVLRDVAAVLRAAVRQGDVVYRYGGEEFLVVFPAQGIASAHVAAERARLAVAELALPHEGSERGCVSISIGVAAAVASGGVAQAIQDADVALYEAKARGRDRVHAYVAEAAGTVRLG